MYRTRIGSGSRTYVFKLGSSVRASFCRSPSLLFAPHLTKAVEQWIGWMTMKREEDERGACSSLAFEKTKGSRRFV